MEAEAALFWRLSRNLAALRIVAKTEVGQDKIAETVDDLEVMSLCSEWPTLRARAASVLAADEARRAVG